MKTYQVQYMTPEGNDGFTIVRAKSEDDAIQKLEKEHPDWIVLDAGRL